MCISAQSLGSKRPLHTSFPFQNLLPGDATSLLVNQNIIWQGQPELLECLYPSHSCHLYYDDITCDGIQGGNRGVTHCNTRHGPRKGFLVPSNDW